MKRAKGSCSQAYGSKRGPQITLCLLVWSAYFTAFPGHAHDIPKEVEVHMDAAKAGGEALKREKKDRRFVPVPVPISNPTLGTGLAGGLLYIWPQKKDDTATPTSISGVGGLYTSTESWAAALFHQGYYARDRFRVQGLAGYGDFKMKFYGIGNDSIFRDNPLDYKATGTFFAPQARFQLPSISKNLYLGAELFYLDVDVNFKLSEIWSRLPDIDLPETSVGVGPTLTYDTRDNVHWPSEGSWLDVTVLDFGDYLGGNADFLQYTLVWQQNFAVTDSAVLQYRFDGQFIDGHAPFYQLSSINLRGLPRGIYADDQAVTLQGQVRWDVYDRWNVLFFGGGGRVGEDFSDLRDNPTQYAGGAGFRYMIDPKSKLTIGADFAYGSEGITFYVQVGDFFAN